MLKHTVYWVFDDTCANPETSGYIGCTARFQQRIKAHLNVNCKSRPRLMPQVIQWKILFVGTKAEAQQFENTLRPNKHVGWNIRRGGQNSCLGIKQTEQAKRNISKAMKGKLKGVPKSSEHCEAQRQAALRRWQNTSKAARARHALAVKEGLKDIDRSGANNANYGNTMSEASKEKMRQTIKKRLGGRIGPNNPNWRGGRPSH